MLLDVWWIYLRNLRYNGITNSKDILENIGNHMEYTWILLDVVHIIGSAS